MAASVPPAMTTSASPDRISRAPSAIASAPEEHADTGLYTPARAPYSMLTSAAAPFGISIGTVRGDTRRAPPLSSRSSCWSRVLTPPIPVPIAVASRSGSVSGDPASAHASAAATSAACWERSSRRA